MARPPKVSHEELVSALCDRLDWPREAAVGTDDVARAVGVNPQTVRNRLKSARARDDVPIDGFRPGEQGGWAWWVTDPELY